MKRLMGWATLAVAVATLGLAGRPALSAEKSLGVTVVINPAEDTSFSLKRAGDDPVGGVSGDYMMLAYGHYTWETWYDASPAVSNSGSIVINKNSPTEITLDAPEEAAGYDGSITVKVTNSRNKGVPGAQVYLGVGGWPLQGETDSQGSLTFPYALGNPNMRVRVTLPGGGSVETASQDLNTNSTFEVQTTRMKFELLGTNGEGVAGGQVCIGAGGWLKIGETGEDGILQYEMFPNAGISQARMSYHYTTQTKDIVCNGNNNKTTFQLDDACFGLINHQGVPIAGGAVLLGAGGWPMIGTTDENGEVHFELFLGENVSEVRMSYNHGTQTKSIEESGCTVFQTGLVQFLYGGTIAIKVGGWPAFVKPAMELLPIPYTFRVNGIEFTLTPDAGQVVSKSLVCLRVVNSDGKTGASGAYFTWAEHGGGPSGGVPGATNSAGYLLHVMDGARTKQIRYTPTYNGVTGPRHDPLPSSSSLEVWTLVKVTVELRNHAGALIDESVPVTYEFPGGGRRSFGTLSGGKLTVEMMPAGSYCAFYIDNYNDTKQRKDAGSLGNGTTVVFRTGLAKNNGWNPTYFRISGGANNTGIQNPAGLEVLPGSNFYFFKSGAQIGPRTIVAGQVNLINASGTVTQ